MTERLPEVQVLTRDNQQLRARNAQLADMLKTSRDKLQELYEQVESLGDPASTYGLFLASTGNGTDAEVFTSGRHMRVKVAPTIAIDRVKPGSLVRLGDGSVVLEVCQYPAVGQLATLVEKLDAGRAIVQDIQGTEHVVRLTDELQRESRAGDTLLTDVRAQFAFERIAKTEVNQLSLEEVPDVTYEDIGGLQEQIELIHDAVELPFAHPHLYQQYDLKPPKGLLLYGPPGCGKTLIAKAVANSLAHRLGHGASAHFINVKGPELLNKFVGETERRIRLIFERARELASEGRPVIIFFDEMESIFRTRGSGVSSDMETTVVPQLLTEIDGVEDISNVIVIGATNREELIDPAILRPGRLDIKVRISRPTKAEALDIFGRYLRPEVPHAAPIEELAQIAVEELFAPRPFVRLRLIDGSEETLHYSVFVSGAMIANIVSRAKKLAIKDAISGESDTGVTAEHLRAAVRAEQQENEDLPNTADPDTWSRLAGRHGKQVVAVEVVARSAS